MKSFNTLLLTSSALLVSLTVSALPTADPSPVDILVRQEHVIPASMLSVYDADLNQVDYNVNAGLVLKNADGADLSTLFTFPPMPSSAAGHKCKFQFLFDPASPTSSISGSYHFDLYQSLGPAKAGTVSGPVARNLRGAYMGTFFVSPWANGLEAATLDAGTDTFDCPAAGVSMGMEMAPSGVVDIRWVKEGGLSWGNGGELVIV